MQSVLLAFLSTVDAGSFGTEIQRNYDTDLSRGNRLIYDNIIYHDHKRGLKSAPVALANKFYQYSAQLRVGSNQQLVTPSIDTGSSDLWVMAAENPYCGTPDFTCESQIFDPETSQTYRNLSLPWEISYLDTTGAFGFLGSDDIVFQGGVKVKDAQFALANTANSSTDVFGIGFVSDESSHVYEGNNTWSGYTYPNLPVAIKDQGLISRVAYSLYLNDVHAGEGQLLFGGVDHSKYQGTLNLIPMVNIYRTIKEIIDFRVILNKVSLKTGDNTCGLAEFAIPVLLDSGTSYALLPSKIIKSMADAMGFALTPGDMFYSGNCANSFAFDSFELDFSGLKLQVPPGSLLDYMYESDWVTEVYKNGKKQCILAIQATEERTSFILGDVFMRNFYIVYDLEEFQIAMAQANFNSADSDIQDIVDSIPAAVSAPYYSSTALNSVILTADPQRCFKPSQSLSTSVFSKPSVAPPKSYAHSFSVTSVSLKVPSSFAASSDAFRTSVAPAISYTGSSATGSPTVAVSVSPSAAATGTKNAASRVVSNSASLSSSGSTYTTSITGPTTLTAGGETYTVTGPTILTITDCGCTPEKTKTSSVPSFVVTAAPSYTTTVVTAFVTTCPSPTTFFTNGQTYTVTESTVITVTDCPCTLTVPVASSNSASTSVSDSVSTTSVANTGESSSETSTIQNRTSTPSASAPVSFAAQSSVSAQPSTSALPIVSTGTVPPIANGASRLVAPFGMVAGLIGLLA